MEYLAILSIILLGGSSIVLERRYFQRMEKWREGA